MNKVGWVVTLVFVVGVSVLGYVIGRSYWDDHNDGLIKQGRAEMREQYAREHDLNVRLKHDMDIRIGEGIKRGVGEYAERYRLEQSARTEYDNIAKDEIEAMIQRDPDYYTNRLCTIPDQMLAERNRIRQNTNN